MISNEQDLGLVAREFLINGDFAGAVPYGNGHINDTYCVTFQNAGVPRRYILQRINNRVFQNPSALMENIHRVTAHLALQVHGDADAARRVLTLIPTLGGRVFHLDASGNYWRTY